MKRVVLAVGGTGGHVLPAMQIGHQMEAEGYQVTYMGFGLSGNRFFDIITKAPFLNGLVLGRFCMDDRKLCFHRKN